MLFQKISELRKNQGFLKYFKNISWLFFDKGLKLISAIVIGSFIARYLGPTKFGVFSYVQSFVAIFIPISLLGLDSIVVKDLIEQDRKRDLILGSAFGLRIIGSFSLITILLVILQFTTNSKSTNIFILLIAFTSIFQSFNVIDFYFQSKVLSKYVVFSNIFMLSISSIIKVILIFSKASLLSFFLVVLLDSFLLAIGLIFFYFRNGLSIIKWKFNFEMAKYLLSNSWPLILSSIFVMMYMRIDQIMIKEILGNEAVGKYAAAVKLSEAWYFIPTILANSFFPAILNSKKIGEKLYYQRLQRLFNLMFRIALIIAIPVTFLSDFAIEVLYGVEYEESSRVLKIHIWSGIFIFLGVASSNWFVAENLQRLSFWRTFFGLLINVFGNLFLIKRFGVEGAAISTLLSQIMASYIFDFFHVKTRKIFYMKTNSLAIFK
ncbi:flippase [Aquimarina longa]|uniref:flippase n=1 Tax=Aquimarina longa TaxID=1080221 RepID=UPI0007850751|nr:flippase [Aquimarina longa]